MEYWIELGCKDDGKPIFMEYRVPAVDPGHKVLWSVAVLDSAGPRIYGVVVAPGEKADLRHMRFRSKSALPKEKDGRFRTGRYELESGYVSPRAASKTAVLPPTP